jgi:hypothetical protein
MVNGVRMVRPAEARADRLIVALQPAGLSPGPQAKMGLEQALGMRVVRFWPRLGLASVEVPPGQLWTALAKLQANPQVEAVDFDYLVHAAYVPDTPQYRLQYHHALLRTPQAWDVKSPGDWPAIVIAVVDTGVDLDHPDLRGKLWINADEIPGNGKDDDQNGFVDDVYGWDFHNNNNDPQPEPPSGGDSMVSHGTLVAGLAGAAVFDDWGSAGVYPNARIMAVQIFGPDGTADYETAVAGIDYALNNGAEIINLSMGAPWSTLFTRPIVEAYRRGIIVVAAAGNSGQALTDSQTTWCSPVCNDGPHPLQDNYVLGVAGTDAEDRKGSWSNYDESSGRHFVDVAAPGANIYGPAFQDSRLPGYQAFFCYNSGTSFAAPLVAGLAALVKAVNPTWGPAQVIERIRATADNLDRFNPGYAGKIGTGRINCARALGLPLAPQPPRNLQAFDTPHDEGGSVTLTWTLSADDGAGSGAVVGYKILRRAASDTNFAEVGQAPAGTDHYEDTGLQNGTQYYYKVGATDGKLISYAGPVGPVVPRDDLPPPAVAGVEVLDRPGDRGGAVVVRWAAYQPPADFAKFRLYRDRWPFVGIGSRTPLVEIPDPTVHEYVDATTVDFTDYYYAVTAVDTSGNEEKNVAAVGPVQSIPNSTFRLAKGIYLLSAPAVPPSGDPAALLGQGTRFLYARWDNDKGAYAYYRPGGTLTELLKVKLGRGFWVGLPDGANITIQGETASAGDLTVDVSPGWMLLGNPYFADLDFSALQVQVGSVAYDLPSAEAEGYLVAAAYVYDGGLNSYRMVSPIWTGVTPIAPWRGFWLRVLRSCQLVLPRPGGPGAQQAAQPLARAAGQLQPTAAGPVGQVRWKLRLAALGAQGADLDNFVAVAEGPVRALPEPPPAPASPRLWIVQQGQAWAAVACQPAPTIRWALVLEPAPGEGVSWVQVEGSEDVPPEYAIMLRDAETGKTFDLRRQRRIELKGTTPRHLDLTLVRQPGPPLVVQALAAVPTARGAEVVFSLSAPAYCHVDILNIAGRRVKALRREQLCAAGESRISWDGRSDAGALVPSGLYLVRLSARSREGVVVQAVRPMRLAR